MGEAYIKQTRSLEEWEYYGSPNDITVLTHLQHRASFKPHGYKGVWLDVGQCVIGYEELGRECGLSYQNVRTCIKHMKKTGVLTTEVTPKGLIVTLNRFMLFGYDGVDANTQTDSQPTPDSQLTKNVTTEFYDPYSDIPEA